MCGTNLLTACSHRRQRGASLISAVFLITALAVLGALMTKLTQFTSTKTVKEWYGAQALYAAESAISAAAFDIITTDDCTPRSDTAVAVSSNSSALYSAICRQPGQSGRTVNLYEITATGTAGSGTYQAQRRIIVQFIP
jgi:Tfp pilus assembly protein PilX